MQNNICSTAGLICISYDLCLWPNNEKESVQKRLPCQSFKVKTITDKKEDKGPCHICQKTS